MTLFVRLVLSDSMSRATETFVMDTEIRYRESSARPYESTSAFLTADDVNELCERWIEAERERTCALLTELLIQICDNTIPEVVSRLPELRGPAGPVGPAGKLPIVREWARETVFYEGSVVTYDGGSYQALRDTGEPPDKRTGDVSRLLVAMPSRSATVERSMKIRSTQAMTRSR
jgi:hypothetical protein